MRKCEKDFDRQVFSFLFCLLDALPLSNLNFRKGKGLLTSRIIEDKRQSCLASYESLGFCAVKTQAVCGISGLLDKKINVLKNLFDMSFSIKIRHGAVPRDCV